MAPTHAVIGAAGARVALALLCMLLAPLLSVSSLAVSPLAHTTALLTKSSTNDQYFDFLATVSNINDNPIRPLQQWPNVIDPNASKFIIKNEKDLRTVKRNDQNGPIKRLDTSIDLNHYRATTQRHRIVLKNDKDAQPASVTRTSRLSDDSEVYSVRKTRNRSSDRVELSLTNSTARKVDRSSVLSKYSDLGTNQNRAYTKNLTESVPTERNAVQTDPEIVTTIATSADRNVTAVWSNQFNGM